MKFNLSDFLQLDTKELLAVNGGSPCSGPTTGPSNNASDPTSPSYGSGGNDGNGGGSSGPGAGASGSGGGACSPTNSKAPDTGNPDSSNPDNNIRSGGGECSAQEPKTSETRDDKYGTTIIVTIYPDGHGTREFIDTKTGEVISSGPIAPYDSGKNDNSTKSTSSEANTNSGRTESGTGASSVGNDGTKGTQDSPSTHESEGSGSHNSNGQGSSTTSSNLGGTSGTTSDSTKNNGENNNNGSNADVSNDTDKVSGMFGQITDGSYADELTMQYYVKNKKKYGVFTDFFDDSMNGKEELFSKEGCKMTAAAKVASQASGTDVGLYEINTNWDTDKNGLLTKEEISLGLNNLLDEKFGDVYDVKTNAIDNPTLENLQDIVENSSGTTYVLGKAADVHGGEHWVVLEGYKANPDGTITFTYDGTSDNDNALNRSYMIGQSKVNENIHNIVQVQTFTVYKK